MDGPVTLLLVVGLAGGEAQLGQLRATLAAQLDPRQVTVVVRRADGVADLDAMLEAAAQRGPVALVSNPRRGKFELKVALQPDQWARRVFQFVAADPIRERNRTVALAIASMTPGWRRPEPLPEADPEPEPELPAVPRLGEPERGAEPLPDPADAGPVAPAEAPIPDAGEPDAGTPAPPVLRAAPPPAAVAEERGVGAQFELAALGSTWPLAAGAQLAGQYCWRWVCAGVAVRGARAEVPAASAEVMHAAALVVARAQVWLWRERLGAALHAGAGPGWVRAERRGQSQDRWLLDLELAPEVWVRVADPISVFLRVGLGAGSGPTPIWVNGQQVSELPVARGQVLLGVRVGR